ncbi:hypothetical protein [Agarivorans sp. QJM3NY_25]|uniref:hypothetical protein n=1 Tax=Agarivorans sp. QJM3NY_25 TaxID=3421430 RepID=UPI003D7EC1D6
MGEMLAQLQAVGVDGSTAVLAWFCWIMMQRDKINSEVLRQLTKAVAELRERINAHT